MILGVAAEIFEEVIHFYITEYLCLRNRVFYDITSMCTKILIICHFDPAVAGPLSY